MPRHRILMFACAVLALSFAISTLAAADAEGYRPQIEAIVNDPLTPEVELSAGLKAQEPTHSVNWPYRGITFSAISCANGGSGICTPPSVHSTS